jgi:L-lactate utilization protein LutC
MKHLLASILLFITISCFAIDQKLIDGAEQYDAAVANLHKILETISTDSMSLDEFMEELHKTVDDSLPEEARVAARNKIDEKHKQISVLNSQYAEAEVVVKKLEPLKSEYDKQRNIENERANLIESIVVTLVIALLLITFFGSIVWLAITQQKKYQKLLKAGKINQAEYDSIVSSSDEKSTLFRDDDRTNPATGLRMIGGCDSGGNPYGCSFRDSSSENYRTKWD